MPTYEYQCKRCGEITSEFKPMSAPRRQRCPSCRGKVELLISGGLGIVFKGDGFYVNDSRKSRPGRSGSGATEGTSTPAGGTPPAKPDAAAAGKVHDGGGSTDSKA